MKVISLFSGCGGLDLGFERLGLHRRFYMKKLFTVIALLTLSTLLFAQKAGDKISFTATDFKGNPVTSEIFAKNKLTMVNIWGTFCGPCIR